MKWSILAILLLVRNIDSNGQTVDYDTVIHQGHISEAEVAKSETQDSIKAWNNQLRDSLEDATVIPALLERLSKYEDGNDIYEHNHDATFWFGHIFSRLHRHLLVRRVPIYSGVVSYKIFLFENGVFTEVFSYETGAIEEVSHGIRDLNGDQNPDLYIVTYTSSGCCLRSHYTIVMCNDANGRFRVKKILNPTFYPDRKLVYSLGYGHPQYTGINKFRWKGYDLRLLTSIRPETEEVKRFLLNHYSKGHIIKTDTLLKVPAEFKETEYYDWLSEIWKDH